MDLLKQNDTHFTNNLTSNALTNDLKVEMSYLRHKNLEKHAPRKPYQKTCTEYT